MNLFIKYKNLILTIFLVFTVFSCQEEEALPKPKAKIRLTYPKATYKTIQLKDCPYEFQINTLAKVIRNKNCNITLEYPNIDLAIDLTYLALDNGLEAAIKDVNRMATEHIKRGDGYTQHPFEDDTNIGMVIQIAGNVASNSLFYVSDKKKHFLSGSLYFKSRPRIDSLLPAVHYLSKDIKTIVETVKWKNYN